MVRQKNILKMLIYECISRLGQKLFVHEKYNKLNSVGVEIK